MEKKPKKRRFLRFLVFLIALLILGGFYLVRKPVGFSQTFEWNVVFSKIWSQRLGLDWKDNYLAILNDLKPKKVRIPVYWQEIEAKEGRFVFSDYDFMVKEAGLRNIQVILVVGRKTPRWPECHLPDWAKERTQEDQKKAVLKMIEPTINHFKDFKNVYAFQIENEPFLNFGECPLFGGDFLSREIELVKSIDTKRPVITTDSGELSFWLPSAKRGDIFGTTMYRFVHSPTFGFVTYPFPPQFFWLKANLVHLFYPQKPITVSELQAEPWGDKMIYDLTLEEQIKAMSPERFLGNFEYAKQVGFSEIHLWGSEWWYLLKTKFQRPEYWEMVKKLIESSK